MFTLFVTCDLDWSHLGIDQSMEMALILYSIMKNPIAFFAWMLFVSRSLLLAKFNGPFKKGN